MVIVHPSMIVQSVALWCHFGGNARGWFSMVLLAAQGCEVVAGMGHHTPWGGPLYGFAVRTTRSAGFRLSSHFVAAVIALLSIPQGPIVCDVLPRVEGGY